MGNTRYVNWQTRMAVILRDKRCVYCGQPVAYTTGASCKGNASWRAYDSAGNSFHFDHRIPFASGGTSGPENIVLACRRCNLSKGTTNR
ncbi:HNH endonuclease [Chloroflexota bacterium]